MSRRLASLALAGVLALAASACGGDDAPSPPETAAAPTGTDTTPEVEPQSLDTLLTDARRAAYAPLEQRTLDRDDLEEARDEVEETAGALESAEAPAGLERARDAAVAALRELADLYAGAASAAEQAPDGRADVPALRETTRLPLRSLETALDAFRAAGYDIPSS